MNSHSFRCTEDESFEVGVGGQNFVLYAPTLEDREKWVTEICNAIIHDRKNLEQELHRKDLMHHQ